MLKTIKSLAILLVALFLLGTAKVMLRTNPAIAFAILGGAVLIGGIYGYWLRSKQGNRSCQILDSTAIHPGYETGCSYSAEP